MKLILALCMSTAAAFQSKVLPSFARASKSALTMVDESVVGVQAPAGFYDPLGLVEKDGPEAFVRRRAVERKHGRVSMAAITGVLVHNADIEFPGYLSKSADLKFSDVPNGFKGIFAVPPAGLLQILLFFGLVELAWWPANNYSGDYGCGFFGATYEGEEKVKKLNAEMANGRLAMLGIAGAMFGEGQTGQTLAEQFDTLHFSIL
jgi:hypothetical protein